MQPSTISPTRQPAYATVLMLCIAIITLRSARAQKPNVQVSQSQRVTDTIRLKDGKILHGFSLGQTPSGSFTFATPRLWLKREHASLHDEQLKLLERQFTNNKSLLLKRIRAWVESKSAEKKENEVLLRVLAGEIEKIQELDFNKDQLGFFPLEFPQNRITSLSIASPKNRKVGGLAYQNDIDDVETRKVRSLSKELESLGIDIEKEKVDLQNRLPNLATDSERQWLARQAIYEYNYVKSLQYQGTKKAQIRTDKETSTAQLISQFASPMDQVSQLGRELGLPEFAPPKDKKDWWRGACAEAEAEGYRGIVIKIVEADASQQVATVEVHFFAMESVGQWMHIADFVSKRRSADQSQEQVNELMQQPEIQQVISMAANLGLDTSGALNRAIRFGSATREALSHASAEFQLFLGRYLNGLDGPPLQAF